MNIPKPGGTREQSAVIAWFQHAETLRPRFVQLVEPAPSLLAGFDAMVAAVAQFGECELNARTLDRLVVLHVFPDRRGALEERVARLNDSGIRSLENVQAACLTLRDEMAKLKFDEGRVGDLVTAFETAFREQLADWEMKGSDAERLMAACSELANVVRAGGPEAIGDWVAQRFRQLANGRQEPGRGTHENIPWWKWMFLGGFFGWLLAEGIVIAAYSGNWSEAEQIAIALGYAIILVSHLVAFVFFC